MLSPPARIHTLEGSPSSTILSLIMHANNTASTRFEFCRYWVRTAFFAACKLNAERSSERDDSGRFSAYSTPEFRN